MQGRKTTIAAAVRGKVGRVFRNKPHSDKTAQLLKATASSSFSHLSFALKLWRSSAAACQEVKRGASCPCFVGARFPHAWKRTKTRRCQRAEPKGRGVVTSQSRTLCFFFALTCLNSSSEPNLMQVTANMLHVSVTTSTTFCERCFCSGFLLFDCFSLGQQK